MFGHFDDGFAVADGDAADGAAAEAAGVGDGRKDTRGVAPAVADIDGVEAAFAIVTGDGAFVAFSFVRTDRLIVKVIAGRAIAVVIAFTGLLAVAKAFFARWAILWRGFCFVARSEWAF